MSRTDVTILRLLYLAYGTLAFMAGWMGTSTSAMALVLVIGIFVVAGTWRADSVKVIEEVIGHVAEWAYGWDPHGPSDTVRLGSRGEGYFPDTPAKTCIACKGKGAIQRTERYRGSHHEHNGVVIEIVGSTLSINITCPICDGSGYLVPTDVHYSSWHAESDHQVLFP